MKRILSLLLCMLFIAVGAFSVSAETTAVPTTQEGEEAETVTEIYYEIVTKEPSPYPQGAALNLLITGGILILLGVALLCIFLFGFPRWGLLKNKPMSVKKKENETLEADEDTQPTASEDPAVTESSDSISPDEEEKNNAVKLEDLF